VYRKIVEPYEILNVKSKIQAPSICRADHSLHFEPNPSPLAFKMVEKFGKYVNIETKNLIMRKTQNKFLKSLKNLLFLNMRAPKNQCNILKSQYIKSINYSAFDSRHFTLSNELSIIKSENLTKTNF
jgi:hypothetical protein